MLCRVAPLSPVSPLGQGHCPCGEATSLALPGEISAKPCLSQPGSLTGTLTSFGSFSALIIPFKPGCRARGVCGSQSPQSAAFSLGDSHGKPPRALHSAFIPGSGCWKGLAGVSLTQGWC